MSFWHGLAYWLGLTDAGGAPYLWWSGAFGDFSKLTIPATGAVIWWHHRCHVRWCFRSARFDAGPWRVCGKHTPHDSRPTADQVASTRRSPAS